MKLNLIALLIIVLVQSIENLRTNDLCLTQPIKCKKFQSLIRCEKYDCVADWSSVCTNNYCAKDGLTCQIFNVWNTIVEDKMKSVKMNDRLVVKKYRVFESDVKYCPVSNSYELKLSNVCLNQLKCYFRQSRLSFSKTNYHDLSDCDCAGQYGFKFGNDYCTSDEKSCDGLLTLIKMRKDSKELATMRIQKCKNETVHPKKYD